VRPRLRFEAKRLRRNRDVVQYLGEDGLGCFTSGKYPLTLPEAGMLGYVQNSNETTWAAKIAMALTRTPDAYHISAPRPWPLALLSVSPSGL
jgi:hypothetical protein